jgi:hypothetical protein
MKTILGIIDKQFSNYILDNNHQNHPTNQEDVLLRYKSGSASIEPVTTINSGSQIRLDILLPYINSYIRRYNPKSFDIIFGLGDLNYEQYSLPYIGFTKKKDINNIVIPNIDFFTGAVLDAFHQVDQGDIQYLDKKNNSLFIGASTGNFKNNTRILYCKKCVNSKTHKAYINKFCQNDEENWKKEYGEIKEIFHNTMTIPEQIKNKVLVNIDGNTLCWNRIYWQIKSNSIPVYINKSTDIQFFDFYEDFLKTYISCSLEESLSVIDDIFNYSPEKIDEINQAGKEYIKACFSDYYKNKSKFLQDIIDITLDKICTKLTQ